MLYSFILSENFNNKIFNLECILGVLYNPVIIYKPAHTLLQKVDIRAFISYKPYSFNFA